MKFKKYVTLLIVFLFLGCDPGPVKLYQIKIVYQNESVDTLQYVLSGDNYFSFEGGDVIYKVPNHIGGLTGERRVIRSGVRNYSVFNIRPATRKEIFTITNKP